MVPVDQEFIQRPPENAYYPQNMNRRSRKMMERGYGDRRGYYPPPPPPEEPHYGYHPMGPPLYYEPEIDPRMR